MKKLALILSPLSYLISAFPVFAQVPNTVVVKPCPTGLFENLCKYTTANAGSVIGQIIAFMFALAVIIAILYFIYGGIKWVMSRGDKTQLEDARNHILAAIIGLIVVFLAFFLINIVLGVFTGKGIGDLTIPTITP